VKQPGRVSASAATSLGLVSSKVATLTIKQAPEPPAALSKREAAVWREITAALPADWFSPPDLPLLFAYVSVVARHEMVAERCRTAEPTVENVRTGMEVVNPIFRLQDMLSRQIASLATKLRLAQSSRWSESSAATRVKRGPSAQGVPGDGANGKPWQRSS
jgi:phage terminase small subunit